MAAPTKQEMLDAIDTAIYNKMTGGAVQEYTIGDRNIQYMSLKHLQQFRDQIKREISAGKNSTTFATFGRPS